MRAGVALACAALSLVAAPVRAEPFLGEIRAVGFDWAPEGWVFCDGKGGRWC
jgi:hypothetical protein